MTETFTEIQTFLEQATLPYEIWPCDPAMADTAEFCRHYQVPQENSANTILVKSKTGEAKFAVCVLLANCRLNVNHVVRKKLGARKVSFASADETREMTNMEIGGVTPISLPDSLPIWIDSQVMEKEYIILGGGNRSSKLKVSPKIFHVIPQAEIVEDLALLIPA